jgi:hypothetical protein
LDDVGDWVFTVLLRDTSKVSEELELDVPIEMVGGSERVRTESVTSPEGLGLLGDALFGAVELLVACVRLSDNEVEGVRDDVFDGDGSCDMLSLGDCEEDGDVSRVPDGEVVSVGDTIVLLGLLEIVCVGVADCDVVFPDHVTSEL